jgi:DNA-binding transcriptional LysR family regulator
MELQAIRYFLAVADEGSFRRAAERVGVSQPAVSQAIAQLEGELDVRLFDRASRRVSLTPDGRQFLEPARRALAEFEGLRGHLDRSRGIVRGRLEIGTTDVASIYVLPKVYREFRGRYPDVELSVRVEGTESLLRQLREGAIEVAIISLSVAERLAKLPGPGFVSKPLFREELLFLLASGHPLAGRRTVTLRDLAETPLITFKSDSITRRAVDDLVREHGLVPRIAMEMSSPEAIKKLVEVGLGASILPAQSVRAELAAGTLIAPRVSGVQLRRVLGVVWDGRHTLSPAGEAFVRMLDDVRNVPDVESI